MCPKSLLVGAVSAVLSMLLGASIAHAECGAGSKEYAQWEAKDKMARGQDCVVEPSGNGTWEARCYPASTDPNGFTYFEAEAELDDTMGCEVIRTADGRYVPQCDSWAHPQEARACSLFAADWGPDVGMAYENCMVIALHTPGAVR